MAILEPKIAKKQKYMSKCSMLKCIRDIYPGQFDDNLPNISMSRRFPCKFVSSHISQNIFLHMIANKSFHFIFERGGFQNWSIHLYL